MHNCANVACHGQLSLASTRKESTDSDHAACKIQPGLDRFPPATRGSSSKSAPFLHRVLVLVSRLPPAYRLQSNRTTVVVRLQPCGCCNAFTKAAIGTSLVIVGLASLLGAWSHHRNRAVILSTALIYGATGGLGSFAGANLAQHIPDAVQLAVLAVVMAVVAFLMLINVQPSNKPADNVEKIAVPIVLSSGFGAGLLTGLIGVGGGFIIVPALTILLRMPIRKAIGTSLLVIGINSMVGAISYASRLNLNCSVLPFAISTLAAAPIAGRLAHHVPQKILKFGFAVSLLILSAWMLFEQFFH